MQITQKRTRYLINLAIFIFFSNIDVHFVSSSLRLLPSSLWVNYNMQWIMYFYYFNGIGWFRFWSFAFEQKQKFFNSNGSIQLMNKTKLSIFMMIASVVLLWPLFQLDPSLSISEWNESINEYFSPMSHEAIWSQCYHLPRFPSLPFLWSPISLLNHLSFTVYYWIYFVGIVKHIDRYEMMDYLNISCIAWNLF